ncbi:hypothetical protein K4L06_16720 [Lysobacter sp. BMK333-48F3]|uniref:hypothetical protein n=1 Tax=Lysobacter sp. BMK333-48F3 TaxID=2867962 RepID=UPI001C8BA0FE|nr:hypothetical protein [Lysobacter sp. BMK333-48F3]MBX9402955.1 hypothetical protein [Lysobacter sp. BMK333-48F3]
MKRSGSVCLTSLLAIAIALSGCASVRSHQAGKPPTARDDGLVYRLPKRGINIGVAFEEGKQPVLTVHQGKAFADAQAATYVAKIGRNGVGETDAEINVTEEGLLSTTSAKYTSEIDEFIKALAKDAASLATSSGPTGSSKDTKPPPCPVTGLANLTTYIDIGGMTDSVRLDATGNGEVTLQVTPTCPVTVKVRRAGWNPAPCPTTATKRPVPTETNGYFYRVNMPYVVRAQLGTVVKEAIVMLPDESPTYYVKLPRALFASTDNTTTFTDGVLTKHKQKTDSEAIAALKIPADLLRAYVSALGSFFDAFKSTGLKESQADTQKVMNELQKQKLQACIIALSDGLGDKTSDALCAGLTMPGS